MIGENYLLSVVSRKIMTTYKDNKDYKDYKIKQSNCSCNVIKMKSVESKKYEL